MKKIPLLLMVVFVLSACSMTLDQLLGRQPTPPPTLTATNTSTPAPTFTPTVPSPTFTGTPTMVGQVVKTPTPLASPTLLILAQPTVMLLPSSTPLAMLTPVKTPGFVSISVSDDEFYKGKDCAPVSTKFVAQVSDAMNTRFVVLFVRFKSKQTGVTSEWTSIAMDNTGVGTFTHDLVPLEMIAVDLFENAWVQYQLVATDANSDQVGRTDIFDERLTLLECVPPTPFPSITPSVSVP
jgi:hypothetical protein